MEEEETHSRRKSYLEAALTPISTPNISPNNSPSNSYVIRNQPKLGIIETRLKWYTNIKRFNNIFNKINNHMYIDDFDYKICDVCEKGLLVDECNSYYTVYVKRYKDIFDDYKIKIYNDKETCESLIYCDKCMKLKNDETKKEKINSISMPSLVLG